MEAVGLPPLDFKGDNMVTHNLFIAAIYSISAIAIGIVIVLLISYLYDRYFWS
jgi:hypothetical protein